MNERREQTLTAAMPGGDRRDEATRDPDVPAAPAHGRGGLSTADMAAAMERRDDDGTTATATATAAAATAGAGAATATPGTTSEPEAEPLFPGTEAETFRSRWTSIQAGFVDEPRAAVEQADELVAEVIQRLAQVFAEERKTLEGQWGDGDAGDTEGLRVALRRYRSFFERLLSA